AREGRASGAMCFGWIRIGMALGLTAGLTACSSSSQSPVTPPQPTPTPTPAPATLADLSADVTSPEADQLLSCRDDVHARITLTNNAASGVVVTGVTKTSSVLSGNCFSAPDRTYQIP